MATAVSPQEAPTQIATEAGSDYGSDLDEATVDALFSQIESQAAVNDIEQPVILDDHGDSEPLARLAKIRVNLTAAIAGFSQASDALTPKGTERVSPVEIEYDEANRRTFSPPPDAEAQQRRERERSISVEPDKNDTRTPLQRFRTPPKKCLSVTDLISPAWCELQYWYSLTKYGRVRPTRAMKQGSSVHKVLEEQVHTEVPVEVTTKEDRFALRIWNVIQGLRTLRQTGMTREMEVWGVVDGEVVNGIIDQITTTCPDPMAEAEMLEEVEEQAQSQSAANSSKKRKSPPAADQRTLGEYFAGSQYGSILEENGSAWLGTLHEKPETLYIVDVKTRQSKSLPAQGSQTRPTQYQLMMYHRLFSTLAANGVPADRIFERYNVNPTVPFSDTFIAQMSSLSLVLGSDAAADAEWVPDSSTQDSVDVLLAHNNLSALWSLMIQEFARTIPSLNTTPTTTTIPQPISPLLTAEFRTPLDGSLIGKRHFTFSAPQLDAYVSDELRWWRGERKTKGVEIEEAYKCRICDFAESCTWRATKIEEGVKKARLRNEKRSRSSI